MWTETTREAVWKAEQQLPAASDFAVHTYRGEIGAEIAERLAGHAEALRRWLAALPGPRRRAGLIPEAHHSRRFFRPTAGLADIAHITLDLTTRKPSPVRTHLGFPAIVRRSASPQLTPRRRGRQLQIHHPRPQAHLDGPFGGCSSEKFSRPARGWNKPTCDASNKCQRRRAGRPALTPFPTKPWPNRLTAEKQDHAAIASTCNFGLAGAGHEALVPGPQGGGGGRHPRRSAQPRGSVRPLSALDRGAGGVGKGV